MIKEIIYKLFNIEPFPCVSCEVLKQQLSESNSEKRALLEIILEKNSVKEEVRVISQDDLRPVGNKFIPWKVRQQALETEDREKAKVLKQMAEEEERFKKENPKIEELEKEVLGEKNA